MKATRHSMLQVGSEVIDNQHKILIDLAKDLNIAIRSGGSLRSFDALLSVLLNYSLRHFQTEERLFKSHADYTRHCLEHYECTKKLTTEIMDIRNDRIVGNLKHLTFFEDWLYDHIERFDRPMLSEAAAQRISTESSADSVQVEYEQSFVEKRKHKRLPCHLVVDGDIVARCYNATHLNKGLAKILDISPGGLKFHSTTAHKINDLLLISCTIGRKFKMKEKVKVITARNHHYGVEFNSPARETSSFFQQLQGAIYLNRIKPAPGHSAGQAGGESLSLSLERQ